MDINGPGTIGYGWKLLHDSQRHRELKWWVEAVKQKNVYMIFWKPSFFYESYIMQTGKPIKMI